MIYQSLDKSHSQLMAQLFSTDLPDGWKQNLIDDAFDSGRFIAFGAFDGQELVGVITLDVSFETADLEDIVVKNQFRKQGVASELLKMAESQLKESGVCKIFLEVRASNQTAINFYSKKGFEQISTRKSYYSDGENALVMLKEI